MDQYLFKVISKATRKTCYECCFSTVINNFENVLTSVKTLSKYHSLNSLPFKNRVRSLQNTEDKGVG